MGMLIAYLLGILTAAAPQRRDHNAGNPTLIPAPFSEEEKAAIAKREKRESRNHVVNIASLVVLAIYAGFTIAAWWQMRKTNETNWKQLVGTQAAVVKLNGAPSFTPPISTKIQLDLAFRNDGIAIARKIQMQAQMRLLRLSDNTFTPTQTTCNKTVVTVIRDQSPLEYLHCILSGVPDEEVQAIRLGQETVAFDAQFHYWNGFFETEPETVCFRFQPVTNTKSGPVGDNDKLVDCETFARFREMILR